MSEGLAGIFKAWVWQEPWIMALKVSVDGNAVVISGRGGREKKRIPVEQVDGVDLGAPRLGLRLAGVNLPWFTRGAFRSDAGTVYCDYGDSRRTITIRLAEGSKYRALVYGVEDPLAAHAAISEALVAFGRGGQELVYHKTEEDKLRELIEQSKYVRETW